MSSDSKKQQQQNSNRSYVNDHDTNILLQTLIRSECNRLLNEFGFPQDYINIRKINQLIEKYFEDNIKDKLPYLKLPQVLESYSLPDKNQPNLNEDDGKYSSLIDQLECMEGEIKVTDYLQDDKEMSSSASVAGQLVERKYSGLIAKLTCSQHCLENKLIVENFNVFEKRLTIIEEQIKPLLQALPALLYLYLKEEQKEKRLKKTQKIGKHLHAAKSTKKLKREIQILKRDVKQLKQDNEESKRKQMSEANKTDRKCEKKGKSGKRLAKEHPSEELKEPVILQISYEGESYIPPPRRLNSHSDIYYAKRLYDANMFRYKKSQETLNLNTRVIFNPYAPVKLKSPPPKRRVDARPRFIYNGDC